MALQAITPDGTLHWQCYGGEEDDHCLALLSVHASKAMYRLPLERPKLSLKADQAHVVSNGRGAVIVLPQCHECGAQCSLKADSTLSELFKATLTLLDANGDTYAYALKISHVHNLMLHHWLYQHGMAEYAPVLPLPDQAEISDPRLATFPGNVVLALWFGYRIVQHVDPRLESFEMILQEIEALPTLSTIKKALIP